MRILSGRELQSAIDFIAQAALVAKRATCERSKCGSIIVKKNKMIGLGFNSPPGSLESQRRCSIPKVFYHEKVTDKTCCIHAEQRAIDDALTNNPKDLEGSRLYFVRLDGVGKPSRAGEPYCTSCSKRALDVRIAEFVLWRDEGVCVYGTEEYNSLSYEFGKK